MALNPMDRVVRDISDIKRQLAGRSQLNHSSLENTAIPVYDEDGTERLRIGAQDDGTHSVKYVQGPPPPRPTAPVVSVDGPVVRVRWDGMLLGGHIPEDFARIDVHFALATEDLEDASAVRGNLATSAGNETVLAATETGTYRVGLVAMSQSRARSEMSETVDVDVTLVDIEGALDAVVENARGGSNYYSPEPPSGTDHDPDRDLWFDTSVDAEGLVSYSPHRWDADLQEWVSVADQRTAALQDALGDFEGTVEQRFTDADTAIDGLRDSLTNLDETTLPALRQGLDAAEGRLGEAEGQITDAFGQLEAVPGQISAAQQAAIDAAAQDAGAKANAARQAAQDHADLVAQGAEDDAIAAAEIRAQQLADAAQQAAEQAAALDATKKANAAQSAAEAKAQTAQQKADLANDKAQALIEAGPNIIVNGDFENPSTNIWPNTTYQTGISVVTADHARSGTHVMRADSTTGNRYPLTDWRDSAAGRIYYAEVWCYQNDTDMTLRGRVAFYAQAQLKDGSTPGFYGADLDGKAVYVYQDQMTPGQWNKIAAYITTPADTLRIRVAPHVLRNETPYDFDDFKVIDVTEAISALREARSAQDRAEAAHSAAGSAQAAADAAMSTANGLAKVLHGTTVATGTAPNGSIWWQHKGTLSGPVIGQWNRVNGSWMSTPISSDAIANLDVGKLTAGAGEIAELVSQKIAAATGQFLELDVGQLTVTQQSRLADVVAEQIAADTARFMELEVGKLVASEGILDEAVIKQLFAEVVVSQMSFADSFIGGNAILEGSITAESGIIGSLDLGVAIVGKLHGQYVEAGSIDTEQLAFGAATGDILAVDALNFKTARGLDIVSSSFRAGDTVEITEENGFRQYGPDGALLVSFPTDGSRNRFGGEVEATQFTATGSMSIQGPGQIAAGGQLQVESGVTAPATSPRVSATYDQNHLPRLADGDRAAHGLAHAGGLWWRWVEHEDPDASDRGRLEGINDSMEVVVTAGTGNRLGRNGLTAIGSEVFMLGPKTGDDKSRWVAVYTTSGTFVREWKYVEYGSGTYQPGIGRDEAGNLLIAQCGGTGYYRHRVYNKATGAVTGQVDGADRPQSDFSSIYVGAADFGATRIVVGKSFKKENERQFVVYTANAQEFIREQAWYTPGRTMALAGFCWADGRFHSLTGSSTLTTYEPFVSAVQGGDESGDWWMSHTWASGSAETPASAATRFAWPTRARVRVTIQAPPRGADRAYLYLGRGPAAPARAGLHRVHTATTTAVLPPVPIGWQAAPTPPAINSFTDDTPGLIRSVRGGFEVRGDGSGHWGPLTFHPDGSMSSSSVPEWIPITTFKPGFTPQTWGYVPAYRIWPDGKVEWRGVIQGTVDVTKPILEIPPEARPNQAVNGVAATNSNVNTVRVEFKSNANPNDLTVYPVETTRTWISLEGLFYYRE